MSGLPPAPNFAPKPRCPVASLEIKVLELQLGLPLHRRRRDVQPGLGESQPHVGEKYRREHRQSRRGAGHQAALFFLHHVLETVQDLSLIHI